MYILLSFYVTYRSVDKTINNKQINKIQIQKEERGEGEGERGEGERERGEEKLTLSSELVGMKTFT